MTSPDRALETVLVLSNYLLCHEKNPPQDTVMSLAQHVAWLDEWIINGGQLPSRWQGE